MEVIGMETGIIEAVASPCWQRHAVVARADTLLGSRNDKLKAWKALLSG